MCQRFAMGANEISKLVELADNLVYEKTGHHLDAEEKTILGQTLKGKKLSAIRCFGFAKSYIQQGLTPKLWKKLSEVVGEKVCKRNVLNVLQRIQQSRQMQSGDTNHSQYLIHTKAELNARTPLDGSVGSNFKLQDLREPDETEHPESKKVNNGSGGFTAPPENPSENKNRTYGLSSFTNFINAGLTWPGMPLLLSFGGLSCLAAFSWLANWYGLTHYLAGELPKAQLGYSLALKLNPLSASAHYNQGLVYEDQQNYVRAHVEYQQAIEGGLVEAYNNQARLYIIEGKYDAAIFLLGVGLPLAKDKQVEYPMYKNRGWARLEQGHTSEAQVDLLEAIHIASDHPAPHCLLAKVLEQQGKNKDALKEWENCVRFASQLNTQEEDKWIHMGQQRLAAGIAAEIAAQKGNR